MRLKVLGFLAALALTFTAVNAPLAIAEPTPTYWRCPSYSIDGDTSPTCQCKLNCGNGGWLNASMTRNSCAASFAACCNNWGSHECV